MVNACGKYRSARKGLVDTHAALGIRVRLYDLASDELTLMVSLDGPLLPSCGRIEYFMVYQVISVGRKFMAGYLLVYVWR